jgi:hypothetical protein
MTQLVPVTEAELTDLVAALPPGEVLPLTWGDDGASIVSAGDGLALWALRTLAALRGVDNPAGG